MSKYAALATYLAGTYRGVPMHLGFGEIENVLGFQLPNSARSHRAWWANETRGSHSHAQYGWVAAGFEVGRVDFRSEHVSFQRASHIRRGTIKEPSGTVIRRAHEFEDFARKVMEKHYGAVLQSRAIGIVPKTFDFVSADSSIVGDAKYFTLVRGVGLPPAKFSVIAEHVWLLEKTGADRKFLVFGNDKRVPTEWLKRYGHQVKDVEFHFLSDRGRLERLR